MAGITGGVHTVTSHDPAAEVEFQLQLTAIDEPASGVRLLELTPPDGGALPAWAPGAHVDLHLGELIRQYSLCGDPADRTRWQLAVLLETESRGGSRFVHDRLAVGDRIVVRGPRNHFPLQPAPRYRFIAGGIGVTPLIPMIAAAEAAGAQWELHYGGRSRASMAFADELAARHGDRVRLYPKDETGRMSLAEVLKAPADGELIYCCGPATLLNAVEESCASWPEGTLHLEHFEPREVLIDGEDVAFEVELAQSGLVVTVAADQPVIEAIRAAGVDVIASCEEGTCGTCETEVLGGLVDHRDSLLTPAEQAANDVMYVCVSRAARGCPRLVLDR